MILLILFTPSGNHCPAGMSTPEVCPAGFFCPKPAEAPIPCGMGKFCPRGSSTERSCPADTFSTRTQQSSSATCTRCRTCTVGAWETTPCTSTGNRECTMCTGKPDRSSYTVASSACTWVCDSGFYGGNCTQCLAGFWCKSGVANRCPQNSESPPGSFDQSSCVCSAGFFSLKTTLETSWGPMVGATPCAKCQAGSICPGVSIVPSQVHSEPIAGVEKQLVLADKAMPDYPNLVTLFESIPATIEEVKKTLTAAQRLVSFFTIKICRDNFCAMCDGSEMCIPRVSVQVSRGRNGRYAFSVSSLKADVLYTFEVVTAGLCFPRMNINAEYVTGNRVAIASISNLSFVPIECPTDSSVNSRLTVTGTTTSVSKVRRLLESAKRRLLQQSSASNFLAMSFVVPTNETSLLSNTIANSGITIEGFVAVDSVVPNVTSSPLSCPENATSPEGSTSITQCVCKPGYQGDASAGTPCSPCPPGKFCSGGLIDLCAVNALAPPLSSRAEDCACVPGFYGSRLACKQCPVNHFCSGGGLNATKCTSNAFAPVQSTSKDACTCVAGYHGTGNTQCVLCPSGSWCWGGIANTCPVDSVTAFGASSALDCSCKDGYRLHMSTDHRGIDTRNCLWCSENTYCKVRQLRNFVFNMHPCPAPTNAQKVLASYFFSIVGDPTHVSFFCFGPGGVARTLSARAFHQRYCELLCVPS